MPIRFRCGFCNQLMGISRRKAGEVVRCPTCAGQVIVPKPEANGGEENASASEPQDRPALFEHSDFDKELFDSRPSIRPGSAQGDFGGLVRKPPPPAPAVSVATPAAPPPAPQNGILLTPGKATVLAVVFVLLLGAAFFAGMMVGRP